eukprot:211781-Chlamydomonas_euryale.AAC.1
MGSWGQAAVGQGWVEWRTAHKARDKRGEGWERMARGKRGGDAGFVSFGARGGLVTVLNLD